MRNALVLSVLLAACGGDDVVSDDQPSEVITTITLTFLLPGGAPVVAEFDDPDGDGGAAPTVDPIALVAGTTYQLAVGFQNRLEAPPEEITGEVSDESFEHQIFFTGSAVDGPASDQPNAPLEHTYADTDANGLPIGLSNMIVAGAGTGQLTITLRHLPELNGSPQKTMDLAGTVRSGGIGGIPGDTDATATFPVTVAAP